MHIQTVFYYTIFPTFAELIETMMQKQDKNKTSHDFCLTLVGLDQVFFMICILLCTMRVMRKVTSVTMV